MKKLLSLALALLLLAVMLPVTAMADTYTYPAGVTAESFPNEADYDIPGGSTGKAAAVVAYEKDGTWYILPYVFCSFIKMLFREQVPVSIE